VYGKEKGVSIKFVPSPKRTKYQLMLIIFVEGRLFIRTDEKTKGPEFWIVHEKSGQWDQDSGKFCFTISHNIGTMGNDIRQVAVAKTNFNKGM
jgi:hypothetical protein